MSKVLSPHLQPSLRFSYVLDFPIAEKLPRLCENLDPFALYLNSMAFRYRNGVSQHFVRVLNPHNCLGNPFNNPPDCNFNTYLEHCQRYLADSFNNNKTFAAYT